MRQYFLLGAAILGLSAPVSAAEYTINYDESSVSFSGGHAGNEFKGVFETWEGQIDFNPEDLENSTVTATFDLSTARTGNKMYDGTLPKSDWFNVEETPTGTFTSTAFELNEDGTYKVTGDLTLRDTTEPVEFNFTLSDLSQAPVTMTASFPIDRLAYDIGRKSDAEAEWVSQDITMTLNVVASPKE